MTPIHVVGIGADGVDGFSAKARSTIAGATFLAGGRRHLGLIGPVGIETFAVGDNLADLVARLKSRRDAERCVILASGDPLCFGIGGSLLRSFPANQVVVLPALSSLQLAFAAAGLAWEDAAIASVHGRPLEETLRPLLGRRTIGLFTQSGETPGRVARFFLDSGLDDYRAWVCENLETADERILELAIDELPMRQFSDLHVLILRRSGPETVELPTLDHHFLVPDSSPILLTHADVRAVTLNRFHSLPDGPIWDVGAGLGGVSIDLARRFPSREIIAVERSPIQVSYLRENRIRFSAHNLRIVEGSAPGALAGLPDPTGVFLGGSGGNLRQILDSSLGRLPVGGVFVANFVGLENLSETIDRLRRDAWPTEVTQVQISRSEPLAGLTTFVPLRPVWVIRSARPDSGGRAS